MLKNKISRSQEIEIERKYIEKVGECESCGHIGEDLIVHHLEKKLSHPELRFNKLYWIVLCVICHKKTEEGRNTKEFNDNLKKIKGIL